MRKVRILIVDDEPLARDSVRVLLSSRPDVEIVGECENGREAVKAIAAEQPDLVFLDIQMPEMDGFGVIKAVGAERMPTVVFATAYDQYALQAFEAQALDYLLKPFDDERFESVLERAIKRVHDERVGVLSSQLVELLGYRDGQTDATVDRAGDSGYSERILIKEKDAVLFLKTDDIDWIEAAGDYVLLHVQKKEHLLRESMTGMEKRLDATRFVRIHRSTIVNLDRVFKLQPYFHGDYIVYLTNGDELKLSRRYWKRLEDLLGSKK